MVSVPSAKPAQIIERLAAAQVGREPALGRHDREGEKRRAGAHEGEQQERGGQRVARRIGDREGEHHAGIDDEVEHDVEKAAEIGEPRMAGHRAVQAVGEAVEGEQRQAGAVGPAITASIASSPARSRQGDVSAPMPRAPAAARPVERRIDQPRAARRASAACPRRDARHAGAAGAAQADHPLAAASASATAGAGRRLALRMRRADSTPNGRLHR